MKRIANSTIWVSEKGPTAESRFNLISGLVMRSTRHPLLVAAAALAVAATLSGGCRSTTTSGEVLATDRIRPASAEKYPDFSQPLDSAMAQMSDEEATQQEERLSVLARKRQAGAISSAEYRRRVEELRQLGQQAEQ